MRACAVGRSWHSNEISGALSGLTRVRKFMQDDAHIFCAPEQVQAEVASVLKLVREVYGVFGFKFALALSTRPDKYIGSLDTWARAEAALRHGAAGGGTRCAATTLERFAHAMHCWRAVGGRLRLHSLGGATAALHGQRR